MPTPDEAVAEGHLHKITGVLSPAEQEMRLIYATPRAVQWMEENLEHLDADGYYDHAPSPTQQADDLFYSFISGDDLQNDWPPHVMQPSETGVWELRTADLRFFGWFWRQGVFIVSAVDQAARCKQYSLYAGYRDQCIWDVRNFGFDDPPFVNGELADVL